MYKYIGIIALSIMIATSVQAGKWTTENCTNRGGTIIKANEYDPNDSSKDKGGACDGDNCNGMEFCRSNKTMNWWSAITWCEAHGGKLASFASLCPNSPMINDWRTCNCPNLKGADPSNSKNFSRTVEGTAAGNVWALVGCCPYNESKTYTAEPHAICE